MKKISTLLAAASVAISFGISTEASLAQSGPEYFKGKTVTFIVPTDPGGGYDTYGRLVAEFMQKHIPDSTFVVRNMPGAGHLIGTNYLFASKPDGLTIGTFNTGLIYTQLVSDAAVKFDLTKMSWIGKAASDPRVIVASNVSGIETFEQLMNLTTPAKIASCGVGCASTIEGNMLIETLKMPAVMITGYNGNEEQMALRRGEAQIVLASKSSIEPFIKEGHGHYLAQIGGHDTDAPQLAGLVSGEAAENAVNLIDSQVSLVRLIAGPPNIPADILATLRDALSNALQDPELLEKAAALQLPIDPLIGHDVAKAIDAALDQTPEMVDFLKEALGKK